MSGRSRGKYWTASLLKRRGWTNALIRELLPDQITAVKIEKDLEKGFDYRKITLEGLDEDIEKLLESEGIR